MKQYIRGYLFLTVLVGAIIALDQWSKILVRRNLAFTETWVPWDWLANYARIVHWKNSGAAFGLGQNLSLVFTILAVIVMGLIIYYFPHISAQEWYLRIALGLQLGGAAGIFIDRVTQGYVTDFISVGKFPVFNVADSSISIGVAVLILGMWIQEKRTETSQTESGGSPNEEQPSRQLTDMQLGFVPLARKRLDFGVGRDLKTVIITGGNSGLGYECGKSIVASRQGWCVVIASRNKQRISEAAERLDAIAPNSRVEALTLNLASLTSVRNFVEEFLAQDLPPLRALVCNAGIQVISGTTFTEDGFEQTFGVNHLGHFLLVNLLLKNLVPPARIIVVSSDTHDPAQKTGMPEPYYDKAALLAFPERNVGTPQASEYPKIGRQRYTTSKLCNIYFTYELFRRLEKLGLSTNQKPVTVNAFNPGLMPGTGLAQDYSPLQRFAWNHILPTILPVSRFFIPMNSVNESGQALARLVLDPSLERISGKYYSGLREELSSKESYDLQNAFELWETSVNLVKLGREETLLWTSE